MGLPIVASLPTGEPADIKWQVASVPKTDTSSWAELVI